MVYHERTRGVPKNVIANDAFHSGMSMITIEDDDESFDFCDDNEANKPINRALEIVNMLDDLDNHLDAALTTSDDERKKLGKLYSTMPILKPVRQKSSENLAEMRNATFDTVPMKKAPSPFDSVIRGHEKRLQLDYCLGSPSLLPKLPLSSPPGTPSLSKLRSPAKQFPKMPSNQLRSTGKQFPKMPLDKLRRVQSVPMTDSINSKWEGSPSSSSNKNATFKPLHKPVRKQSMEMISTEQKQEAVKTLAQRRKCRASTSDLTSKQLLSLSKPAFRSSLIEAAAIDILSKPVRRSSMEYGGGVTVR
ncbi:MAG: hypothetical protein SGBAC_009000 [Bacillariaceae sp.]